MKNILFIILLSTNVYLVKGQTVTQGDSTVVDKIKVKTSWIYENKDKTSFLLTSRQLLEEKTNGISVTEHSKNGTINRIIAISFTDLGQLSAEWYFDDKKLIYSYQTFEFFNESEHLGQWKNFKGLWAWGSRYYFENEELKYYKVKGRAENHVVNEDTILKDAKKILNYAKGQMK